MLKKGNNSSTVKRSESSDDSSFVATSQLSTVLDDYGAAKIKGSSSSSGGKYLLPAVLLFVILIIIGGYAYIQQIELNTIQERFQKISQRVDQLTDASVHALSNDSASKNALNLAQSSLINYWGEMKGLYNFERSESLQAHYETLLTSVRDFQAKEAELREIDELASIVADGGESRVVNSAQVARSLAASDRIKSNIALITKQAAAFQDSLRIVEKSILSNIFERQKISAYAAIFVLIIALFFVLRALFNMKKYEQFVSQERNQLKALVDEWQSQSEEQRQAAQERYIAAQRVNEANQNAILLLMNELQNLADGDLTQQATVTEDITGAIADSVNYTMEELRNLVSQVQSATGLVSKTTAAVEKTSAELLASSDEQLREIKETGQAVMEVAVRINGVSEQAQQSAIVARQSLDAAEKGMLAVQNAISGMNTIRDQIQDTSKRIKRLVESSQEIGEITDLIADITEQTNVLALNAAIQAASAGEAGRGFSIVAEEVQRLAERSAGATRQIAALIKSIQGDMHDAMEAMEMSTRDVVEGARQTDDTGTAFTEIDSVTRRLASLTHEISKETQNEAKAANEVVENIKHIFNVTEQTANGTRSTAHKVRELARVAEQLERSVARFRIS